jgi:glutaredoxin/glutathione-dependent peroxiredoxin
MTIQVGDRLPQSTFRVMTPEGPQTRTTDDVFKGRKMVLVAVPGAFTPTCHRTHLPGFIEKAAELKAKGVEGIAVTSTNDAFVLDAWGKTLGAGEGFLFLADGNADFAKAVGLANDSSGYGLGIRSKRYAMLVEDGVVRALNTEDAPGKAEISSAETLLKAL